MSNKISLCLIVGNVAEYINRCLESFAPMADEICIVRAIGNQNPDETLELAKSFCQKRGIPFRSAIYQNKPGHESWPHIDDFAAARQASFDLASHDYCFWCDTDDILVSGAERIKKHAAGGEYACFMFPYDIFGKNVVINRERMMLKSSGRWEYAVHEHFKFHVEPVTAAVDEGVVIQHLPKLSKTGSNERNLKILESIPKDQLNCGLKYHLHGELFGAGRTEEAVQLAVELLQDQQLGKDERYDLLLALTLQTTDMQQRIDLLHEAHKTDPIRREALGVLSCTMMDTGKPVESLAYARQMMATTRPENECWNSRKHFYTYTGDDIYQQALRVNGRIEEAEKVRQIALAKYGGPRIALIHATRGRPEQASKCRKAWHDLAEFPEQIEHVFAIDSDDKESAPLRRFHHVVVPAGGGCVRAWNFAAGICTAPVYIQLSDDWIPTPKWDSEIIARIGDLSQPKVLAISDGHRKDNLLCMAIMTRKYYEQDWFMFHPDFTGVYSDNHFTDTAYARGAVIEARDIVFEHKHPAFETAKMDATYAAQNNPARYRQGLEVFNRLANGDDWSTVPGFFNYYPFYHAMAERLQDGDRVAEIGVWFGRSLIHLAQHCKRLGKRVKFYAVDTFKGESNQKEHEATVKLCGGSIRPHFEANLKRCGVSDMVKIIESDSALGAACVDDKSLAFCFVDAAHDYASVKRDIAAWLPKVKPGGIIAGHDIQHAEVKQAVDELLDKTHQQPPIWVKEL